tara:strand:+ start:254 stop:496 length:243 start_codon:yes stop_codon:yes gene_type:complete
MNKFEMKRQEQLYLDHIIWLWSEYDRLCQQLASETNAGKHGLLLDKLDKIYHVNLGDAYDAYYRYFGYHCTYQPKLSHLA